MRLDWLLRVEKLLLRSNPNRQQTKAQYCGGIRKRGKTGKHRKVEVKRRWWALDQSPYSAQGNGRLSPRKETMGIDHPMRI